MMTPLRITGGKVVDPAQGLAGVVGDVLIADGRIVDELPQGEVRALDATGKVVMAGAIDMHAHVASATASTGRRLQHDCGWPAVIPTLRQTGDLYTAMGYTTVMEAAVAPSATASAHAQLDGIPVLDAGLLLLLGNHEGVIGHLEQGDRRAACDLVRQLMADARAWGIKSVNATAVAAWRRDAAARHITGIDQAIPLGRTTPRSMLNALIDSADEMQLAHPLHIHGPQLGAPGGVQITTEMIDALDGRRAHLAHLQYYAYGSTRRGALHSEAERLLKHLLAQRHLTADLGMVAFGPAFTATADLPLEHDLFRRVGAPTRPARFSDSGNEDCFGLMPYEHRAGQSVSAVQWATGLELALLCDDLTRLSLTVDHPNGGSFTHYPQLIALLMSHARRQEAIECCHAAVKRHTGLAGVTRELTLSEIAVLTRVSPAMALGLPERGHLRAGAVGDVVVYDDRTDDPAAMFAAPRWVIKDGDIVVDRESERGDAARGCGRRLVAG